MSSAHSNANYIIYVQVFRRLIASTLNISQLIYITPQNNPPFAFALQAFLQNVRRCYYKYTRAKEKKKDRSLRSILFASMLFYFTANKLQQIIL